MSHETLSSVGTLALDHGVSHKRSLRPAGPQNVLVTRKRGAPMVLREEHTASYFLNRSWMTWIAKIESPFLFWRPSELTF